MSSSLPACVCVSDIHWGLTTLREASQATTTALELAEELNVPLCILGDLNDTKDIIRGKVLNALIKILQAAKTKVYILIGNHDLLNEKSREHGLNCLRPYATVIDQAQTVEFMEKAAFIPYQGSNEAFMENLSSVPAGWTVFMHQGVKGAYLGEYAVDHSSVDPSVLAPYNCISGHYHRHQTVDTLTYCGSPYTISFTEASDGPKGCLVVNHDGSWRRVIFDSIRRHFVVERDLRETDLVPLAVGPDDLVWLKLRGTHAQLDAVDKKELGLKLFRRADYKLDLIYDEVEQTARAVDSSTAEELMDAVIDSSPYEDKSQLKKLWRELCQ